VNNGVGTAQIQASKKFLRTQAMVGLKSMTISSRETGSGQARTLLQRQALWQSARTILFHAPQAFELDIWPLLAEALAAGQIVALPRFVPEIDGYRAAQIRDTARDVRVGKFGIREPVEGCPEIQLNRLDLVLVPGVAFDLQGRRLGRGRGYFDRLLADMRGMACGVAFDQQIVGRVPAEPHDTVVNCILTPTRWIEV
jgi:5-formyltetrahydrofolate cyclo-ligase